MFDMSSVWSKLDQEIERTPMPDEYKDTKLWVLCRDCHKVWTRTMLQNDDDDADGGDDDDDDVKIDVKKLASLNILIFA